MLLTLLKIVGYLCSAVALLVTVSALQSIQPSGLIRDEPPAVPTVTKPVTTAPPAARIRRANGQAANGSATTTRAADRTQKPPSNSKSPKPIALPELQPTEPPTAPKLPKPETPPQPLAPTPPQPVAVTNPPELPASETSATTTLRAAVATSSQSVPEEPPRLSFIEINAKTRAALMNIICTTKRSGLFEPLSGSGIMVDSRGVILTNAHIAQYFLLKDYLIPDFIECLIRTGEPARNRYKARLLYISPLWVEKNYQKIDDEEPLGTGEHDFALLLVSESINPETLPLPSAFPALTMEMDDAAIRGKNQVLGAGYPAGFLSGINIQKDLYPSSAVVTVGQVYSFGEATPDLFSIGGSVLAQQGSSGGAVVGQNGGLIGLFVTASDSATTEGRDLRAITMSHIARSFKEHTGDDLEKLFDGDLAAAAESFNGNVAPALRKLLEDELNKK